NQSHTQRCYSTIVYIVLLFLLQQSRGRDLLCYLGLKMLPARFIGAIFLTIWASRVVTVTGRALPTAFAQRVMAVADIAPTMPQHSANKIHPTKVEVKPDLKAKTFSPQNAFFFATLSSIAYKPKGEARGLVAGNSTCEGMGFDHFYWFEQGKKAQESLFDAIQDTEAFVAANDDMIAVVFRGTQEKSDWVTNLKLVQRSCPIEWNPPITKGGIHEARTNSQGFDEGVTTVWEIANGMRETIKKLYNEEGKNRKLYVAGHSLGGALATLAAARLHYSDDVNISSMYTFGSPRVFNRQIAAFFDCSDNCGTALKEKYFRCRNNNDVVPRVPFTPYKHVGTEIYLDRFGQLSTCCLLDRLLGRLSSYLRGDFIEGIDDHAISEYARHFKQAVINSKVPVLHKAVNVVNDAVGHVSLKIRLYQVQRRNENLKKIKMRQNVIEDVKNRAKAAAK
ncbi:unnamed protein product, partial [Ascophyllum nodosum]